MLKIIPTPIGQTVGDLVDVELEPWEIDWSYDKLQVGFTEGLTDQLEWFLSADNVNQSFTCYITLKKQNTIKKVKGTASAIWEYEPPKDLKERIREIFGKDEVTIRSEQKEIKII